MQEKKRFTFGDKRVTIAALILVVFGSLMIASAEMGNSAGDTEYLTGVIWRQAIFVVAGILVYFFLTNVRVQNFRPVYYTIGYVILFGLLLFCRLQGQINGAYAWIRIGPGITVQPSEFAKVFMIAYAGRILGRDRKEKNESNFFVFIGLALALAIIILFIQHDLGSAVVYTVICYCVILIPDYKEIRRYQRIMILLMVAALGLALFILSPPVTEIMKKHADNYMIGRFLAAADPFLYQYDNGYHIIMSLVSFANGGLFGLGYGNSIHKYMNFPNPSNDFILPVIVEELGIVGFTAFILAYGVMLYPIIQGSFRSRYNVSKMTLLGVFVYFAAHFILNVGGVSGLIPLTGVPLLMISSGGSSLVASMAALGLCQNELMKIKKDNESNSGKIQKNTDKDIRG
ncbi:MAG: FtsW/RodA/SpoVE family cell cycle protein [Erysipelotrichaceae bacterium]|nr:FtsW/RodA/SpoVE family cell cycle protein [Erysipelotrichaceae bacterium]